MKFTKVLYIAMIFFLICCSVAIDDGDTGDSVSKASVNIGNLSEQVCSFLLEIPKRN